MATTRERTVINWSYFNSRIWKPALREAGVPMTRANDAVFAADDAAANLTQIQQVGD